MRGNALGTRDHYEWLNPELHLFTKFFFYTCDPETGSITVPRCFPVSSFFTVSTGLLQDHLIP
jgi:hypothetical protein